MSLFVAIVLIGTVLNILCRLLIPYLQSDDEPNIPNTNEDSQVFHNISLNSSTSSSTTYGNKTHTQATKSIKPSSYQIIYNDSQFDDNLNYQFYSCTGIFIQTNRKRTKKIEAFNEQDAFQEMLQNGFKEPITITPIPFPTPTERQIEACRKYSTSIPTKACQYDVSAIMSKEMDNDSTPNPELLQFATEKKIQLSYYIGKKAAYDWIFFKLDTRDRIAFFAFCVYRFLSDNRAGNLNTSPYNAIFYEFADLKLENSSFIKSMNKYQGCDLRFFGNIRVNDYLVSGGSKNTIAYKETVEYLKNKKLI